MVIKLQGVIDNEFLYSCESENCRLLVSDYMYIKTSVLVLQLTLCYVEFAEITSIIITARKLML